MARLTLDWVQLAAVVGTVQGVLLAAVLLAQRSNRTANRLLAALMLAFTLYLATSVYYTAGVIRAWPHLFGASYPTTWLFGPLVYLYAVAASDRAWRFGRRDLLHLLPAAAVVLVALPTYAASGAEKLAMYERWMREGVPPHLALIDPTKYVSGIAYSAATVLFLRRHRRRIEDSYANVARVNLSWLLQLSGAAAAIWAMATALQVSGIGARFRDEHVTVAIALMVYAIGYLGLRQPEVFRYETDDAPVPVPREAPRVVPWVEPPGASADQPAVEAAPPAADPLAPRYERSGLGEEEAARLEASLLAVMESERPWRDSALTLADLAARVRTTPHKLSEVLNARVGQTFHDFVNGYRVREVQRRIQAGEARRLKMLALALDAGFASKSTFNEVFKKHTRQTPSDFQRTVGA